MNKLRKFTTLFFAHIGIAILLFLVSGCKDTQIPKKIQKAPLAQCFDIKIGKATISAKIAVSDAEKAKGLMNLKELGENCGMFFIYDSPQRASFWMKDTLIPLDIAFFDKNGTLTEIKKMYPMNLNSVSSSRSDIMFCLETNAGWFEKCGVKVSDKIDMQVFVQALEARGKVLNLKN